MKYSIMIVAMLLTGLTWAAQASTACTVCQSKNPKMVRMHKALEYKDCFSCHGPASKRKMQKATNERVTDPLCSVCHAAGQRQNKKQKIR